MEEKKLLYKKKKLMYNEINKEENMETKFLNKLTDFQLAYLGLLRSELCYWDNMKNDKKLTSKQAYRLIKKLMKMKGYIE